MSIAACNRLIDAPVDVVWDLLSTAEGLNTWMSIEADVDLRAGGPIRWVHEGGWVVAGEIREVVPMRRLVFTFGWEQGGFPVPVGSSVVTITLTPHGDRTHLDVSHQGLTEAMAEQHTTGWHMFVDRLGAAAAAPQGLR